MRTTLAALGGSLAVALAGASARAQPVLSPDARVDVAVTPPEGKTSEADTTLPTPPPEAPPPRPHRKGLVLETTLGALAFVGDFRHVAPPAPWLHGQLGYEIFDWLMVFGEAELAFTDTSETDDPSHSSAFPLFGFGGGLRGTVHFTPRVAMFLQGEAGAIEALVPRDTLANLGYAKAETFALDFGGRLGFEWYQIDRHLALVAQGGVRDAPSFARTLFGVASSNLPLMWDAAGGLRYTF